MIAKDVKAETKVETRKETKLETKAETKVETKSILQIHFAMLQMPMLFLLEINKVLEMELMLILVQLHLHLSSPILYSHQLLPISLHSTGPHR